MCSIISLAEAAIDAISKENVIPCNALSPQPLSVLSSFHDLNFHSHHWGDAKFLGLHSQQRGLPLLAELPEGLLLPLLCRPPPWPPAPLAATPPILLLLQLWS